MALPDTHAAHRLEKSSRFAIWLLHHRVALADTATDLVRAPLAQTLVAVTLGVALALPALLWIGVDQLATLSADWNTDPKINLFVQDTNERSHEALLVRLRSNPEIAAVQWQSADDSLAEFLLVMGFDDAAGAGLDALGADPLPAVALITPMPAVRAPARLEALADRLADLPGVAGVQIDLEWVQRLAFALQAGQRLALGLGILFGAGVLLAVGGLTLARIQGRRDEIIVLRLVGATDAFLRRPFLYAGACQGALGGFAAVVLVAALLTGVAGPMAELAASYGLAGAEPVPFGVLGLALPGLGAALGWIGARVALGRSLASLEP